MVSAPDDKGASQERLAHDILDINTAASFLRVCERSPAQEHNVKALERARDFLLEIHENRKKENGSTTS